MMPAQIIRFAFGAPTNAGKQWSDMDDSDLLDFDGEDRSIAETAEFLCRTEAEVLTRLEDLKPKAS
jgi:hypothetical protein